MASTLKNGQKDGARFSVYLRPCQLEWLDAGKNGCKSFKVYRTENIPEGIAVTEG